MPERVFPDSTFHLIAAAIEMQYRLLRIRGMARPSLAGMRALRGIQ